MAQKSLKDQLLEARQEIDGLKISLRVAREESAQCKNEMAATKEAAAQVRAKFEDLKMRVTAAESDNQFLRGYMSRVQEDDVVREELVATGDPQGPTQLVPKRKHQSFNKPSEFTDFNPRDGDVYSYHERNKRAPQHYITY